MFSPDFDTEYCVQSLNNILMFFIQYIFKLESIVVHCYCYKNLDLLIVTSFWINMTIIKPWGLME